MSYDSRSNPNPSEMRGRRFYAVDGFDARDGVQMRALFEARDSDHAVAIAVRDGMAGDLIELTSGEYLDWKRWADSLIPMHARIILPRPTSGLVLGRLEVAAPCRRVGAGPDPVH